MTVVSIAAVSGMVLFASVLFGLLASRIVRTLYDRSTVMWVMIFALMWVLVFLSLCVKAYTRGVLL